MVCVEQKSREKSGDADAFAAQHGAKPHGQRLQRHFDDGHGLRELGVVELNLVDQVERLDEAQDSAARKKEGEGCNRRSLMHSCCRWIDYGKKQIWSCSWRGSR
jgi:hypothetical protein